jgi:hypothetical protein
MGNGKEEVYDHTKLIYITTDVCHMNGRCLASQDAQSEGRSRDEDGSW